MPAIARADTVGSLLRPAYLREVRQGRRAGHVSDAELRTAEDRAVCEAIALQEAAGLDVINDGELRRGTWIVTTSATSGHNAIPADPNEPYWLSLWKSPDTALLPVANPPTRLYVTARIREARDISQTEYAFLTGNAHTRTKFTIPAPSWHRVYWHPVHSRTAYATAEAYLHDMRDYIRGVVERVIAMGCDYVQLDAPNYGMFHCDTEARTFFASQGRSTTPSARGAVALPVLCTSVGATTQVDAGWQTAAMRPWRRRCSRNSPTSIRCSWSTTRRGPGILVPYDTSCRSTQWYSGC
jgi:5-methyltetrahydropteroyltriglutamate--homocysteine methyltransferase